MGLLRADYLCKLQRESKQRRKKTGGFELNKVVKLKARAREGAHAILMEDLMHARLMVSEWNNGKEQAAYRYLMTKVP